MTHMPGVEVRGEFTKTETKKYKCYKCQQETVTCKVWESSCGGWEDYKYSCENPECLHSWWVDGIDS